MTLKILSGGQTGVDRAALDAAMNCGMPHGGWCPKERRAEFNTIIPKKYFLQETDSSDYAERTKLNVRDADATLIFANKKILQKSKGTLLTIQEAEKQHKPYLLIDLSAMTDAEFIKEWISKNKISILNIAGPRESQHPGIYKIVYEFLKKMFFELLKENSHVTLRAKL